MEWFGVKSLFLITTSGKPKKIDKDYKDDLVMYEERIILVHAKDFNHAILKAEKDAKRYCKDFHYNIYGQKVKTEYLKVSDAFMMFDTFEDLSEIYSFTEVIKKPKKIDTLIDNKFGKKKEINIRYRKKFRSA